MGYPNEHGFKQARNVQSLFSSFDLVPMEFKVQSNGGEHHTGFIYSVLLPAENAALSYSIKEVRNIHITRDHQEMSVTFPLQGMCRRRD